MVDCQLVHPGLNTIPLDNLRGDRYRSCVGTHYWLAGCQENVTQSIMMDIFLADAPDFEIRTRPQKHEPDMFYVNKYLKLIEKELF